ncbi:MAG: hypothetical protein M1823_005633 [Watsoniomyces obsoletus]|nr:MAG: hypothetical protein M1823_005633 [Watsoniomyces obsoletus]
MLSGLLLPCAVLAVVTSARYISSVDPGPVPVAPYRVAFNRDLFEKPSGGNANQQPIIEFHHDRPDQLGGVVRDSHGEGEIGSRGEADLNQGGRRDWPLEELSNEQSSRSLRQKKLRRRANDPPQHQQVAMLRENIVNLLRQQSNWRGKLKAGDGGEGEVKTWQANLDAVVIKLERHRKLLIQLEEAIEGLRVAKQINNPKGVNDAKNRLLAVEQAVRVLEADLVVEAAAKQRAKKQVEQRLATPKGQALKARLATVQRNARNWDNRANSANALKASAKQRATWEARRDGYLREAEAIQKEIDALKENGSEVDEDTVAGTGAAGVESSEDTEAAKGKTRKKTRKKSKQKKNQPTKMDFSSIAGQVSPVVDEARTNLEGGWKVPWSALAGSTFRPFWRVPSVGGFVPV